MIVVLKNGFGENKVEDFISDIKSKGLDCHVVKGVEKTIVGLLGDTSKLDPRDFLSSDIVESAERVSAP